MNILFCGSVVPNEIEFQVKGISAAGNRFQNNMIKNLEQLGHEVRLRSFVGVPISPEIENALNQRNDLDSTYVVKGRKLINSVRTYGRLVGQIMNDTDIVVCYNITYAWLFLPYWAKRRKKKSIVILADYSESISYKSVAGKLYAKLQLWSMRQFETVVGLSANIRGKIKKNQEFVLMEGGIDQDFYDAFAYRSHLENQPLCFMYAGLLSQVTGVDMLLQAMELVECPDIRLIISGKGPLEEAVKKAASKDDRICYKGHMVYQQYIEQLQTADVFLNPRNMRLPENQNNFPSKIMDYLATGKRIISTKFAGWESFRDYLIVCESNVEDIAAAITQTAEKCSGIGPSKEDFDKQRHFARNFLWSRQIERMIKPKG